MAEAEKWAGDSFGQNLGQQSVFGVSTLRCLLAYNDAGDQVRGNDAETLLL